MAEYENVEDELNAIMNGNYETEDDSDSSDAESDEGENLDTTDDEDTDREDESEEETETNDDSAESDEDTEETEDEEDEENALVDDDGSEDEDDSDSDETEESDEDEAASDETATEDEDDTDTEAATDGKEAETTDDVDYRKQYETLLETSKANQEFYDKVAGVKFKANGKEFEGFKDPKKIIQAQQMAYNYSEKMAGFKQYRPYMGPLKDRGMIDDPTKFDLAMSLIDGDKEALKQHISNLGIDPIDLDMENIAYVSKAKTASRDSIAIEDALEAARAQGVGDKVYNTVMKEWDDESFRDFVSDPHIQSDLIEQMANGDYDTVMTKVGQMGVLDTKFASMKKTDQYKAAIRELVAEDSAQRAAADKATQIANEESERARAAEESAATIAAEKAAAAQAIKDAKYEQEVARKNAEAKDARKKASAVSKKKPNASKRQKADPLDLTGAEISSFLDKMIMGKK